MVVHENPLSGNSPALRVQNRVHVELARALVSAIIVDCHVSLGNFDLGLEMLGAIAEKLRDRGASVGRRIYLVARDKFLIL